MTKLFNTIVLMAVLLNGSTALSQDLSSPLRRLWQPQSQHTIPAQRERKHQVKAQAMQKAQEMHGGRALSAQCPMGESFCRVKLLKDGKIKIVVVPT